MCAPFCNSPNCSTDCRMFLTCILALDQETVATRFKIDLGLAELYNVRDSVAPRSYVDSRSQAFSDSWAWARLEAT